MNQRWYALYTRPKFEKKVEEQLYASGFEVWLPLQTVVRQWSDRKKKMQVPLFSSYVFIYTEQNQLHYAVQTDGVACTVGFDGVPAPIREEQLDMIRKILIGPDAFEAKETFFIKGDPVRVIEGPLKGNEGRWVKWRGKKRVALEVEHLNHVIFVDVPLAYVEKIHEEVY